MVTGTANAELDLRHLSAWLEIMLHKDLFEFKIAYDLCDKLLDYLCETQEKETLIVQSTIWILKAEFLIDLKRLNEVEGCIKKALECNDELKKIEGPDSDSLKVFISRTGFGHFVLGLAHSKMGNIRGAVREFEKSIDYLKDTKGLSI